MSDQEWSQTNGGLDPTTLAQVYGLGPVLDADQATVVSVFADADVARACFRNLQAREVQVSLEVDEEAEPAVEEQLRERAMGRGVVLGATVGATVGFVAATYLVPPGAVTATGTMLTTLAGAALGSFVGSLVDRESAYRRRAAPTDAGNSPEGRRSRPEGRQSPTVRETAAQMRVPGSTRDTGAPVRTWRLVATVHRAHVDEVVDLIAPWRPGELRVE